MIEKYEHQLQYFELSSLERILNKHLKRSDKINVESYIEALIECGFFLTRCEIRSIFNHFDKNEKGHLSIEDLLDKSKNSDDSGYDNHVKKVKSSKESHDKKKYDTVLLSESITNKISRSVRNFIKSSKKSLWKHITSEFEGMKDDKFVFDPQKFHKIMTSIDLELSDEDEGILFDSMRYDGKNVHVDDIISFFISLASHEYVNYAHMAPIFKKFLDGKVPPKELARNFIKYDEDNLGYIDKSSLEKIFKKLKVPLSSDELGDIEHVADPDRRDNMDFGLLISLSTITIDVERAITRMKNCLKLMRDSEIDYEKSFEEKSLSLDETVKVFESFGLPIVHPELQLIASKYASRGKVSIDKMLRDLGSKPKEASKESGNGYEFGKALFKKLCKLRANESKKDEFRKAILSKDSEIVGHINRRDFQRALDNFLDLSEEESALLAENISYTDGRHMHDIDYPIVLLILYEPLEKSYFQV